MNLKGILLIFILFLAAVSAIFFYLRVNKNITAGTETTMVQENEADLKELVVAPQIPKDKVVVSSAIFHQNGFLVVRQMDDGQLSQVIEMSQPLTKGTHKNISINLGSTDVTNKELIVMIYEDYANDSIFNDLDMPALNENGNMTASFVKTGKPLPSTITEGESVGAMAHNMADMKSMAKVRYTNKGFVPNKIEVEVGSMVEFINDSSMDMWVASVPHPAHSKLPTFDQFRLYKKGAIYRFVFGKKGIWEYHDHISPSLGGVVTVN